MKTHSFQSNVSARGYALLMVIMFIAISMIILGGALRWTSTTSRLNQRSIEYWNTAAAAEAATEKTLSTMVRDFRAGGEGLVFSKMSLNQYQSDIPDSQEASEWSNWKFTNPATGNEGIYVVRDAAPPGYVQLNSIYSGLYGLASTYSIIANATSTSSPLNRPMSVGVHQQFQVATIPIFQFAIFYGIVMEIHPGPEFHVTGRVHSNNDIYYSAGDSLTFHTDVTSVGDMIHGLAPGDHRTTVSSGSIDFRREADEKVAQMHLPIGTNNTPEAVYEILKPPPVGELPTSDMGSQRFYNKADLIVQVTDLGVTVSSGLENNFATVLSTNEWQSFIAITNSFTDHREEKTVQSIDLDIGALKVWNATNSSIRSISAAGEEDVTTIYVKDTRTLGGTSMSGVRVHNGRTLPSERGLTVATDKPVYVQGHYNQPTDAYLGTTNTTTSFPAAFAADAINVLSENWQDSQSNADMNDRDAANTTINAAFLAGIVPSTVNNYYSGGVENYPRFHEDWGSSRTFTYNGSMVVLFDSQYATNRWGKSNVYNPPARRWAFDSNFLDSRKLPPGTPAVTGLIRNSWAVVKAGSTNVQPVTVTSLGM